MKGESCSQDRPNTNYVIPSGQERKKPPVGGGSRKLTYVDGLAASLGGLFVTSLHGENRNHHTVRRCEGAKVLIYLALMAIANLVSMIVVQI